MIPFLILAQHNWGNLLPNLITIGCGYGSSPYFAQAPTVTPSKKKETKKTNGQINALEQNDESISI